MKKLYIILSVTTILVAMPITREKALELFEEIKRSEYSWVIGEWEKEIKIKTQSRSSSRTSVWDNDQNPIDTKSNEPLIELQSPTTQVATTQTPVTSPNIDPHQ